MATDHPDPSSSRRPRQRTPLPRCPANPRPALPPAVPSARSQWDTGIRRPPICHGLATAAITTLPPALSDSSRKNNRHAVPSEPIHHATLVWPSPPASPSDASCLPEPQVHVFSGGVSCPVPNCWLTHPLPRNSLDHDRDAGTRTYDSPPIEQFLYKHALGHSWVPDVDAGRNHPDRRPAGRARTREGQLPPMDVPPAAVRAIHVHEILRQTDTDSQCRHCSQQQQLPRQMCDILVHTRRRTPEAMKLHTALTTITARISSLTCIRCMSPVASIPSVSSRRRRRRKPERIRYPASVQSVNHRPLAEYTTTYKLYIFT